MQKFKNMSTTRSRSRSAETRENRSLIRSLKKLDDEPSRVIDSQEAYEIMFDLYRMARLEHLATNYELLGYFIQNKSIVKQFSSLFAYLAKISNDFDYDKDTIQRTKPNNKANLNERRISILYYIVIVLDNLSRMEAKNDYLYEVNKQFMLTNGLEALTLLFKQEKFLSKKSDRYDVHDLMLCILRILRNLSEIEDESCLKLWSSLRVIETIKSYSQSSDYPAIAAKIVSDIERNLSSSSRLDEGLAYLQQLRDPASIIDDAVSYEWLLFIQKLVYRKSFQQWKTFLVRKCDEMFGSLLSHLYKLHNELNFADSSIRYWYLEQTPQHVSLNERRISIFHYLLRIIDMLCYRSVEFCLSFPKFSGLKALFSFCNNYKFTSMLADQNQYVLETIMFCLNFLSRYSAVENVQAWSESSANLVNHLIKISRLNMARSNLVLVAGIYCVIGNLAKDDVIKQLPDLPIVLKFLLTDVISIADEIKEDRYVPRDQLQFYNEEEATDEDKIIECDVSIEKKSLAPITGKLHSLARLCANENSRVLVCQRVDSLKLILYRGNDIERLHVLRLLLRVCKDDKCARFVMSDRELYDFLKELRNLASEQVASSDFKNISDYLIDYSDNYITHTAKLKSKSKSKISASHLNSDSTSSWSPAPTAVNRSSRQPMRSNSTIHHASGNGGGAFRPQPQATAMSTSRLHRQREPPHPQKYPAEMWTEKQVDAWFDEIKLNPVIREAFAPCDGQILRQISKMRPEFVYQIFNTENGNKINLREIAVFYFHLEKLFPSS